MGNRTNGTGGDGRTSERPAHGFMTLVADEGQLLDVAISPPTGGVQWVVHLLAYPCDLSIHLDRAGMVLLADRIGQALQDADSFMAGPHDPCKLSPGADDEEVDLDDPDMTGKPGG